MDLIHTPSITASKVYLNNGAGGFNTVADWDGPMSVSEPSRLFFGDANGDGKLDWIY